MTKEHPIISKAKEIALEIEELEQVKIFKLLEKQVKQSQSLNNLIENIKKKQKELVHAKHFQKTTYAKMLEEELAALQKRFENMPLVKEYQQYQVELNAMLQMFQQVIINVISKKITLEKSKEISGLCNKGCSF